MPGSILGAASWTSFFLFFDTESFIVSIWSKTWERAPGWLRMVPRGCRKGLPAEAQAPEERLQGPWAPEIPSRA